MVNVRFAILALLGLAGPALAVPDVRLGSARFGNVFTADEPAAMRITVSARKVPVRGVITARAEDAYGKVAARLSLPIAVPPHGSKTVEMPLPAGRLGFFQGSARLLIDGLIRARAWTTLAVVPPVVEDDPERSAAGYFVYFDDAELPWANAIASQMRRLGIRWVRLPFPWDNDARRERPNTADPSWLDTRVFERWVDAFRANGIEVLGVLVGTARWASSAPDDESAAFAYPRWAIVVPADLDDWALMASTMAERLRGRVRFWEIWNEPDGAPFWDSTGTEFGMLAAAAARALRGVDPSARVAVNVVGRGTDHDFQLSVLAQAGSSLDIFGYHYADRRIAEAATRMRPLLRTGATIWNTEAYGPPRRNLTWWLDQRAGGVERIFTFIYHRPFDDRALGFARFGLYPVNVDYTPRLDALVQRTLSDVVGSATPTGETAPGRGWEAYWYATPGGPVVALTNDMGVGSTWEGRPGVRAQLAVPEAVTSLTTIDLMGNRRSYPVRRGRVRVRILGVGAFFQADPPDALTDLRVVRVTGGYRLGQPRPPLAW